jgi:Na+-translocating ferredoxin:NAD+ oxidoreductase RnfC subunit
VERAAAGVPVTRKFVSVTGAVARPKSFWAPVGTPLRELLEAAGGATVPEYATFVSGLMMGTLSTDPEAVVTKTTAGLIVLPRDHYLVDRRARTEPVQLHIGKSGCDQCSYCTEFCPRYLLGYDVRPHLVMRSLGFTRSGDAHWNQWAQLCCSCGICTLYACPEDLYPKEACDKARRDFRSAGLKFEQAQPPRVHPMKEYRRVPLKMLRRRLKVEEWESEAPFENLELRPARVRIRLLQGAGKPAKPVVRAGDAVHAGATIGRVPPEELGADIHASIDGTVAAVTGTHIEIAR